MSTPSSSPAGPDTRKKVLEAAIGLMRRSGFSGAGINEILKESGAPKGSLYHFFPQGKKQIVCEALAMYAQNVLTVFDEAMSKANSPGDKVKRLFHVTAQRLEDSDFQQSCAGGAVSLDLDVELEAVRLSALDYFEQTMALFARHFGFNDKRRTRAFAGLLLTAIEGGYIRGRAERSSRAFKEAAAWLAEVAEREARDESS
jgi:TetR/AcrR family transcriptional regulator, lmrAB and yxaGH operons repressor